MFESCLVMLIDFLQCWDGVNLTALNRRSHLVYGEWKPLDSNNGFGRRTTGCPSSHPIGIPHIEMIVRWTVDTTNSSNWKLSFDNYTSRPGGCSAHADYVFAWDDTAFLVAIDVCYHAYVDCCYSLGDGREPAWRRS